MVTLEVIVLKAFATDAKERVESSGIWSFYPEDGCLWPGGIWKDQLFCRRGCRSTGGIFRLEREIPLCLCTDDRLLLREYLRT